MAIATQSGEPNPGLDKYTALFHRYIARSVEAVAASLSHEPEGLSASVRDQTRHILGYALKLPGVWASTREVLLALTPQMEREGFRYEWITFLQQGVQCSTEAGDPAAEAQLALAIGRLYRLCGDYGAGAQWLGASRELFVRLSDARGEAISLNQLAYVARLQGRHDEALDLVNAAQARLGEDDWERATCHFVLGTLAQDRHEWELAVDHHRVAYQMYEAAGDARRAAWCVQNLGNTLRSAGRFDEAILQINDAIQRLGALHDPINQAIARMNLGIIYAVQGNSAEARALYELAEAVFRSARDELHLAMVYVNLAIEERTQQQWQKAEAYAAASVRLWETLREPASWVNTLDELALAYQGQARWDEARATFVRAEQVLAQVPPGRAYDNLRAMLDEHLADLARVRDTRGTTV